MMTFAMSTYLGPFEARAPRDLQSIERDLVQLIETDFPALRWVANHIVLGDANYVDVFEVPDMGTALEVAARVRAYGPAHTEVWPVDEWPHVKRLLHDAEIVQAAGERAHTSAALVSETIGYLRGQWAAFRLTSYPAPEAQPTIAHVLRAGTQRVSTSVVLVGGRPALACVRDGAAVNTAGLGAALDMPVYMADSEALPGEFQGAPGPIPPLGHLFGIPLFVDDAVAACSSVAFGAFSTGVCVELSYDDFARIEQPKVLPLGFGGELGDGQSPSVLSGPLRAVGGP